MIDALVADGDMIVVNRSKNFDPNGKMVVVWLIDQEETTLKIFYHEGSRIRLQPKNETMKPIYIDDPDKVEIQGRVIKIIRQEE
jgi:repressor LexA